ncbi:MAG: phage tail tape measure C-terminal domain-containing protein [Pseudomonadota bacterium]
MTEKTHTIRLQIDAAAAKTGSREFTSAVAAVKAAVRDLEKDSEGAFRVLKNIKPQFDVTPIKRASTETNTLTKSLDQAGASSAKSGTTTQRAALAASMALRQASTSAQKLAFRLDDLGDAKGLEALDAGLDRLNAQLRRAPDVAGVRIARNEYENLRTELTQTATAAEYAKGAQAQLAREAREAATAADQHASAMERLRREFVPLYEVSKTYEAQLDRIAQAERENILSADQAAAARDRAAQSLLTAGRNADAFAGQMRGGAHAAQQVGFQLNDIGVMLAGGMSPLAIATGQGTQLAQTFQTLGSRAEILSTLKAGFLSMVSPISLVTIGAIALGAALYYGLGKVIPQAKSLEDAIKDLDSALSTAKNTAREASDLSGLAERYGAATTQVQALVAAKRDLARLDAGDALKEAQESFQNDFGFSRWWDTLRGYANNEMGQVRKLRDDLDLTKESATQLNTLLREAMTAPNAQVAADKYAAIRDLIVQSAGGLDKLTDEQGAFVRGLNDMEDKARQFVAIDMARTVTAAKDQTDAWLSSMNGVAAQARNVFNTLQSLSGLKINISAPTITMPKAPTTTLVSALTPKAPTTTSDDDIFAKLTNITDVSYHPTVATPPATKPAATMTAGELQAVITASVTRTGALEAEKSAAEQLAETLRDRLTSLQAETLTLQTVAAGTYATDEAARLYAESSIAAGSAIDQQTAAMIRQIDAASKLNAELTKTANDPVNAWVKSVPNWIQAGQMIESQAIESLSAAIADFAMTGKFDFESLGNSILQTATRIIADMAVKELIGLLGGNVTGAGAGGFGLGNILGAVFGGTAGVFHDGGISHAPTVTRNIAVTPAQLAAAPRYHNGGLTSGEQVAVLRDNEAVIPLRSGKVPVELGGATGGTSTVQNINMYVSGVTDLDSFRKSRTQVEAGLARAGQRSLAKNG